MRTVLITRPRDSAADFSSRLLKAGLSVHVAPMIEYARLSADLSEMADCQALVFTSAEGVASFAQQSQDRHHPVFCVGDATAAAVKGAGFTQLFVAGGDGEDLCRLIREQKSALGLQKIMHLSGEDIATDLAADLAGDGIAVPRRVVYRAETAGKFAPETEKLLREGRIDVASFFSQRTAQHFMELMATYKLLDMTPQMEVVCLSRRVAEVVMPYRWHILRIAETPTLDAMVKAITAEERPYQPPYLPAAPVIAAFGGIRPLAAALQITPSTVQGWHARGTIPDSRVPAVMKAARMGKVNLSDAIKEARKNMDDKQKTPPHPERRGGERRGQAPVYDEHGNIVTPTYIGPDRRSGLDRRDFPAEKGNRVLKEKIKFLDRTVLSAGFIILCVGYATMTLLAPEIKKLQGEAQRAEMMEQQVAQLNAQLEAYKARLKQAPAAPAASLGGKINQMIEQAEQAAATPAQSFTATLDSVQQLGHVLYSYSQLQTAPDGRAALADMMGRVRAVVDAAGGDAGKAAAQLDAMRQNDPAMQTVFKNIPARDMGAAVMLLALNEMRGSVDAGRSFEQDLALLQSLAGDDPALAASIARLAPLAKNGVLTRATLQKEFKDLAGDIVMAKLRGEDASVKSRAMERLSRLVTVRKTGDTEGDSVDAVVARAEAYLDRGDVAAAKRELETLKGAPRAAAQPWLDKAESATEAEAATGAVTQEILRQLSDSTGFSLDSLMQSLRPGAHAPYPLP